MSGSDPQMDVARPELSVIIPICSRAAEPQTIYYEYSRALREIGMSFEIIFVIDGAQPKFAIGLRELLDNGEEFTVIGLSRSFGESTAIMAGFEHSTGDIILTLPAYHQIEAGEIAKLVSGLNSHDMVVGRRWPRHGSTFDRMRRAAFHSLLAGITGHRFRDLGCGARCLERRILDEIHLYGEQHRFIALLADRLGFRVGEVNLRQSKQDYHPSGYGLREYIRSGLDLATVFFLTRFTKRPLRFFGTGGAITSAVGGLVVLWIVFERLVFGMPLAERPALLLSSLMLVLGLQLFALGLLGELIIFTHARDLRDYQIERVVRHGASVKSDV